MSAKVDAILNQINRTAPTKPMVGGITPQPNDTGLRGSALLSSLFDQSKQVNTPQTAIGGLSDVPISTPNTGSSELDLAEKGVEKGAGLFDVANKAVNKGFDLYNKFTDLPFIRAPFKAVGAAVGALGAAEGAAVPTVLQPVANLAMGRPLFQDYGKSILDNAKAGWDFGYGIGNQGAKMAPIAIATGETGIVGEVVGVGLGVNQVYTGIKDLIKSSQIADPREKVTAMTQSGLTTGLALLGFMGYKGLTKEEGSGLTQAVNDNIKTSKASVINKPATPALNEALEDYKTVLNPAKSQIQHIETEGGKDLNNVLSLFAQDKITPVKDGNRIRIPATEIDKLVTSKEEIDSNLAQGLDNTKPVNDLDKLAIQAEKSIALTKKNATIARLMREDVSSLIADEKAEYGGNMVTDKQLHDIKNGMWSMGYDMNRATLSPTARKLGNLAKDTITTNNPDLNVQQLNELSGLYNNAIDLAKSVDGNIVKGGQLGNWFSRIIGQQILQNVLGKVPVVGKFASAFGAFIGGKYNEYLNDPERVITQALKKIERDGGLDKQSTDLLNKFKDGLANQGMQKIKDQISLDKAKLLLPEGTPSKFPPVESQVNLPGQGIQAGQENIRQSGMPVSTPATLEQSQKAAGIQPQETRLTTIPGGTQGNIILPEKLPNSTPQGQVKSPSDLRTTPAEINVKTSIKESSLLQEAKKYKSAEEFVKAQGTPVYRGQDVKYGENLTDNSFFTANKDEATKYLPRGEGKIIEARVNLKKPKYLDLNFDPSEMKNWQAEIKSAKQQGYDGLIYRSGSPYEQVVSFSKDNIKTKSQLIDIWNKAHGKTKITPKTPISTKLK